MRTDSTPWQPGDIGGVRRPDCVSRGIGLATSACFAGPTHLFQILQHPNGILWWEASVSTQVRDRFTGRIVRGVQCHLPHQRLAEEQLHGSTVWRYRWREPWTEDELRRLNVAWAVCHRMPYDWWGAFDARLLGGGLLLRAGLHRLLPDRSKNRKWFCSELVAHGLKVAGRWEGNPSQWAPWPLVWDLMRRDLVVQSVVWEPGR